MARQPSNLNHLRSFLRLLAGADGAEDLVFLPACLALLDLPFFELEAEAFTLFLEAFPLRLDSFSVGVSFFLGGAFIPLHIGRASDSMIKVAYNPYSLARVIRFVIATSALVHVM